MIDTQAEMLTLSLDDLDRFLVHRVSEIAASMALTPLEQALAEIREVVARCAHAVADEKAMDDLVGAVIFDSSLQPLVTRARAGDNPAFDELWKRVRPRLQSVIRRFLLDCDAYHVDAVESLVAETVWKKLDSYSRDLGFFLTWVRGIARVHALAYRPKQRTVPLDSVIEKQADPDFELPPSACFAELLRLVQEAEPHEAIAFLYNRYLGWEPARIATELGSKTLAESADLLVAEIVAVYPILVGIRGLLAPLRSRAAGLAGKRLAEYCREAKQANDCISHWAVDLAASVARRVIRQGREFLRLACELRAETHERLSFIWCCFLRRDAERLSTLAHLLLREILEMFRRDFPSMTHLKPEQIVRCTTPLEKQILPEQRLADCARHALSVEVDKWVRKVNRMLRGPTGEHHVLAYSYLCGCLPGVAK
jgi:DNA-directed RNA polymerase specialized sigma24 family protein